LRPYRDNSEPAIEDDRQQIEADSLILLIVEDDMRFAESCWTLRGKAGFKGILAAPEKRRCTSRKSFGLRPHPGSQPARIAWTVGPGQTEARSAYAAHSGAGHFLCLMSAISRWNWARSGILKKPVEHEELMNTFKNLRAFIEKTTRAILVVEDDERQRKAMVELIGDGDLDTIAVGTDRTLAVLRDNHVDCMVVDLGLPDMSGFELINRIRYDLGSRNYGSSSIQAVN